MKYKYLKTPELTLSKVLNQIEIDRKNAQKIAGKFAEKHGFRKDEYRVKDVPSVIKKWHKENPEVTKDFIGFRKDVKKKDEAETKWQSFNKKVKVTEKEDKYKENKSNLNPYRAFHTNFLINGYGAEAQFRTKKMGKIADKMHLAYKHKECLIPYLKKVAKLEKRGY